MSRESAKNAGKVMGREAQRTIEIVTQQLNCSWLLMNAITLEELDMLAELMGYESAEEMERMGAGSIGAGILNRE